MTEAIASAPFSDYHSIFLEPDWAHQRYYGWRVVKEWRGVRVLRKNRLGLSRNLLLLTKDGRGLLDQAVKECCRGFLSDVIIHDFDGVLIEPPMVARRQFRLADASERLLNIATYVIYLGHSEEELWKNLGPKSRNAVRKAESSGVECDSSVDAAMALDNFYALYEPIAARRALSLPLRSDLEAMARDGALLPIVVRNKENTIIIVNLIYVAGASAIYLYGANADNIETGAGQLAQWRIIQMLRARGYSFYDLGGVQPEAAADGIHKFKKSLGGVFFSIGREFRYSTPAYLAARRFATR